MLSSRLSEKIVGSAEKIPRGDSIRPELGSKPQERAGERVQSFERNVLRFRHRSRVTRRAFPMAVQQFAQSLLIFVETPTQFDDEGRRPLKC